MQMSARWRVALAVGVLAAVAGCGGGGGAPAERPSGLAEEQAVPATVGDPVDVRAQLPGGVGGEACSVVGGGLPPGLALGSDCRIVGTPALPGSYRVDLAVQPATGASRLLWVFFTVAGLTMSSGFEQPTLAMLWPASPWQPVRTDRYASFMPGPADVLRFRIVSGSLPPGLVLDPATGFVSGTPTDLGPFRAEVGVTLIRNGAEWTVPASASEPAVSRTVRVDLQVGAPSNAITYGSTTRFQLSAAPFASPAAAIDGELPPGARVSYTASGLPAWMRIDPVTGVLSGTPTAAGVVSVRPSATVTLANGKVYDVQLGGSAFVLDFEALPVVPRYPVASNGVSLGNAAEPSPRLLTLAVGEAVTVAPGEVVRGLPGDVYTYEIVAAEALPTPVEPPGRPDWVTVDPVSGVVTLAPPSGFASVVAFAVKVTTRRGALSYESQLFWQVQVG